MVLSCSVSAISDSSFPFFFLSLQADAKRSTGSMKADDSSVCSSAEDDDANEDGIHLHSSAGLSMLLSDSGQPHCSSM